MPRVPVIRWLLSAALGGCLASSVHAQVYKCQQGQQTSYQASPCETGKGKQLAVPPPLSASEVEEGQAALSQYRTQMEQAARNAEREAVRQRRQQAVASPRCDVLASQLEVAWGRRNGAMAQERNSVKMGYDPSQPAAKGSPQRPNSFETARLDAERDIERVEQKMVNGRCKIDYCSLFKPGESELSDRLACRIARAAR